MKELLVLLAAALFVFAGYFIMRRLDMRMNEGHKRRQRQKRSRIFAGKDRGND